MLHVAVCHGNWGKTRGACAATGVCLCGRGVVSGGPGSSRSIIDWPGCLAGSSSEDPAEEHDAP